MTWLQQLFLGETMPPSIYQEAKSCLGKHITLDNSVDKEFGCAEAVSYVLVNCHTPNFPSTGFASTIDLGNWLQENFSLVETPEAGDIIISPSQVRNGVTVHGHVAVCGYYGLMSNNSYTGLFDESLTLPWWYDFYKNRLGLEVLFYRPK